CAVPAKRSVEVERERVWVEVTDGIAAAERGAHAEVAEILWSRQRLVARAGDSACLALSREFREMRARGRPAAIREVSGSNAWR
ncbi:unnamed protein product, partial [Urochloa humidicola]